MQNEPPLSEPVRSKHIRYPQTPQEFKVVSLRECPVPEHLKQCETPDDALEYWRLHIETDPAFQPDREHGVVLLLNTRKRIFGHELFSVGTLESLIVHPRDVFRCAIVASASALVLMHNHPSGESSPSEADIKVTRELIRAGQLMKIELVDHIVVGSGNRTSLRELGHFYS